VVSSKPSQLWWFCSTCHHIEPVVGIYDLDEWEECLYCDNGIARVVDTIPDEAKV
jgi:hypothetical protein